MTSKIYSLLISSFLLIVSLHADPLEIGAELPEVSSQDQTGAEISLADFTAEPWLLVYFYPKANTGGCTKQACSLRDSYEALGEAKVKVIGVSKDTIKSQKSFSDKHNLPFTLLADDDATVYEETSCGCLSTDF